MTNLILNTIATKFKINLKSGDEFLPIRTWIAIAIVLGIMAAVTSGQTGKKAFKTQAEKAWSMDSYVPPSHSLIPIRVHDYENLDQLIGQFGVVNLFTAPLTPKERPRFVVGGIKIIRSGQSGSHFSVLVHEDQAHKILAHPGEFHVTVRNPRTSGINFVKEKRRPKSRILYPME